VKTALKYGGLLGGITELLEAARRGSARAVNAIMTATYWEIGRRIVEFEQKGKVRAEYGAHLLERLAEDLRRRFGRGFSTDNLETMRLFYLAFSPERISETLSRKFSPGAKSETALREFDMQDLALALPLSWSHYTLLVRRSRSEEARAFYEAEALRGGWSVRQLGRQISSQFYERTALSRNKAAMLRKGAVARPEDAVTAEEEVKDPFVLEFLGLKDEYSESDLEDALIRHPPVGLILCAEKDDALARYTLEAMPNKVLAAEYRTALPDEKVIAEELERTRRELEGRKKRLPRTRAKRKRGSGKGRAK